MLCSDADDSSQFGRDIHGAFQIFVCGHTGGLIGTLVVRGTDSVKQTKARLADKRKLDPNGFFLQHQVQIFPKLVVQDLSDNHTLSEYGIRFGSWLVLRGLSSVIRVVTPERTMIEVDADPAVTALMVKGRVEIESGSDLSGYHLFLQSETENRILDDNKTLEMLEVPRNAVLTMR